jgi:hypothetical protein
MVNKKPPTKRKERERYEYSNTRPADNYAGENVGQLFDRLGGDRHLRILRKSGMVSRSTE